jgi:RES domain-containing protein
LIFSLGRLRAILPTLPFKTIYGPWARAIGFHHLKIPDRGGWEPSPQPLWPGGAALQGARFTPKNGFNSLYLAADPVTALHEVVSVFTPPSGPILTLRTSPWVVIIIEGVLSNIIDLTDISIQRRLKTTTMELTGDWAYMQSTKGYAPTQLLGQAAFDCGILGFRYKSARNIGGGDSIVVFTDHLAQNKPSYLQVVDEHHNLMQRLPNRLGSARTRVQ